MTTNGLTMATGTVDGTSSLRSFTESRVFKGKRTAALLVAGVASVASLCAGSVLAREQTVTPEAGANAATHDVLNDVDDISKVAQEAGAQAITWGDCPPVPEDVPNIGDQKCALLSVPLDYRAPGGRTIEIAVSRIAAADPAKRRGVLLLNFGGPGKSGLDTPRLALATYPKSVLESYDLIGFDPRGVGRSAPVSCGLTVEQTDRAFPTLERERSFEATAQFASNVATSCAAVSGDKLRFITTANTARDIDRIRIALDEPKISYLGYSYGTYLGAVYSSLFAGRTDRIVLDSAVNPDKIWREQFRGWGAAAAARFEDFVKYAIDNEATVHLGRTREEVHASYWQLYAKVDASPIQFEGYTVDGPMFRALSHATMYFDSTFPVMALLWQAARDGRSDGVAAAFAGAAPAAGFPEIPEDNKLSGLMVSCGDVAWSRSVERYRRELAIDTQANPMFGPNGSHIWPCAFWSTQPAEPLVPISPRGSADNILVVNSVRDPATPLAGARRMRQALGQRAHLLVVDIGGHALFGLAGNTCANDRVASFLVDGTVPADETVCPANPTEASQSPERLQAIKAMIRQLTPMAH